MNVRVSQETTEGIDYQQPTMGPEAVPPTGILTFESVEPEPTLDSPGRRNFLVKSAAALAIPFGLGRAEKALASQEDVMTPENVAFAEQVVSEAFAESGLTLGIDEDGEQTVEVQPGYERILAAYDKVETTGELELDVENALEFMAAFAEEYEIEHAAEATNDHSEDDTSSAGTDAIFDAMGTAVLAYRVTSIMRGKTDGMKVKDYAMGVAINTASYLLGDDNRRAQLYHNAVETGVAVSTIGGLVAITDGFQLAQKDIAVEVMEAAGIEAGGLSDEELGVLFDDMDSDKKTEIQEALMRHEGSTIKEIEDQITNAGGNVDLVGFVRDISSRASTMSRTESLRVFMVGSSTFGPAFTSIMSTSAMAPLIRQMATVEGEDGPEYDKDLVSNLQGFIPNHLAIGGLGFIPGWSSIGKTAEKIPVIGGVLSGITLGADMGPRLALKQLAGENWPEVIEELDKYGVATHLGMEAAFAVTTSKHIARIENRDFNEVFKEVMNPRGLKETKEELFENYGITHNFTDTTLGRLKRMKGLVGREYNKAMDIAEGAEAHAKEGADALHASAQEHDESHPGDRDRSMKDRIRGVKYAAKGMTDPHKVEEEIGDSLTDIIRTLTLQSILVPNVQGTLGSIVKKGFAAIDEAFESQLAREQLGDIVLGVSFGGMSKTCDNFAAQKAAVPVGLDRIKQMATEFNYSRRKLHKRTGAVVKKLYDKIVNDGGALPPGNMPNLIPFSMSGDYTLEDARKPNRFGGRYAVGAITHAIDSAAEFFGIGPTMDPELFSSGGHGDDEHSLSTTTSTPSSFSRRELFRTDRHTTKSGGPTA